LDPAVVDLVLRLARENPRWGYLRIVGECRKLGVRVSATSVRSILRRHHLGPAPRRGGPTWTQFLRAQANGVLACDFLTVETIGLTRLYVIVTWNLAERPNVTDRSERGLWLLGIWANRSKVPDRLAPSRPALTLGCGQRVVGGEVAGPWPACSGVRVAACMG
jgi:hypothetical protein